MMPYELVRSRRKTVAIHVTKNAGVEVRAPLKMPKSEIDRFVAEKEKWIKTHLTQRERLNDEKNSFALNYGNMTVLRGKMHYIRARDGTNAGFDGECFYLPPNLNPDTLKRALVQIYKAMAKLVIKSSVNEYSKYMNITPTAVSITNAKTRWGSCSSKNNVNFSWRLVMADDDVIDYVVVHELAHIREHNHSTRFWAIVEGVLPDYKQRQSKLKILQEKLSHEHWD